MEKIASKRLQKRGPKSQIPVVFAFSKQYKRNEILENHWGASAIRGRRICERGCLFCSACGGLRPIGGGETQAPVSPESKDFHLAEALGERLNIKELKQLKNNTIKTGSNTPWAKGPGEILTGGFLVAQPLTWWATHPSSGQPTRILAN